MFFLVRWARQSNICSSAPPPPALPWRVKYVILAFLPRCGLEISVSLVQIQVQWLAVRRVHGERDDSLAVIITYSQSLCGLYLDLSQLPYLPVPPPRRPIIWQPIFAPLLQFVSSQPAADNRRSERHFNKPPRGEGTYLANVVVVVVKRQVLYTPFSPIVIHTFLAQWWKISVLLTC